MIFEPIKIQAKDNGSKTAIICKDKKYTYSELIKSVEKLAAILSTAIQPDEIGAAAAARIVVNLGTDTRSCVARIVRRRCAVAAGVLARRTADAAGF